MVLNATLLRVDDPPPATAGPAVAVRCALTALAPGEMSTLTGMGMHAEAVMYLPMGGLPPAGAPSVGQVVTAQPDGCPSASYTVVHAMDQVGGVLAYVQLFLAAA